MNILYIYIVNRRKEGSVVGGWTETKRMKTRETHFYMPFVSPTTYTWQESGKLAKDYCQIRIICETYFRL